MVVESFLKSVIDIIVEILVGFPIWWITALLDILEVFTTKTIPGIVEKTGTVFASVRWVNLDTLELPDIF